MRKYELTYLISDNVPENELNKTTGKVVGYITGLGGKVLKEEIWGRRKLAYPIKKQDFATYVTLNFDLESNKVNELERDLRLSSKIVRHLLIVQDFGEETLTLTKEDIAETEAIKEVIGGEKSFEAVEGETEESKDLMAVRGEDEDSQPADKETEEKEIQPTEKIEEVEIKEKKRPSKSKDVASAKGEAGTPASEGTRDKTEDKKEEKPKKKVKKSEEGENEADRLSKLDKELDDILGEDL